MGISISRCVDRVCGFSLSETALVTLAPVSAPISFSNSAIVIAGATVALWCSSFSCSVLWMWFVVWMTFCWTVSLSMTGWMVSWIWLSKTGERFIRPLKQKKKRFAYWWTCSCSFVGAYCLEWVVSSTFFSLRIPAASSLAAFLAVLSRLSISSSTSFSW